MIPVEQAALIYNTDVRSIKRWAKQHQITYSRIGEKLMIDEVSLARVIELKARISRYDEYLEEILVIKEKEIMSVLLQIDDLIYLFKSIKKISPLLRTLVDEMALLIPDESRRNIFTDVILIKNLSEVAKKNNLPRQKVTYLFDSALKCIQKKIGFLLQYRNIIADLKFKNRLLELESRNQKERIGYLCELLKSVDHQDIILKQNLTDSTLPPYVVKLLFMRFDKDFDLDTRVVNCLRGIDIETLEDLLRFLKEHGLQGIREARNVGEKSFAALKSKLIEQNIIDKNGYSYLFKYLS